VAWFTTLIDCAILVPFYVIRSAMPHPLPGLHGGWLDKCLQRMRFLTFIAGRAHYNARHT
jgi:hypothetical protein